MARFFAAAALAGAFSLTACAADVGGDDAAKAPDAPKPATAEAPAAKPAAKPTPAAKGEAAVRAAIAKLAPQARIERIGPAPLPGYMEVVIGGQLIYVSDDARYLIQGSVMDIPARKDLTEVSRAAIRRDVLKTLGPENRIVFAPAKPKHTVTVFTDIDCGYCRKLHAEIGAYNAQGIAVEYLFFPRTGIGSESFAKAVAVWCAADRRAALTAAKAGDEPPKKSCKNPITMEYAAGQKMGIDGTPAIITADGTQIGGYLPPKLMRERLDAMVKDAKPSGAPAGAM